ncbi:MAG: cobalt ECF transporter T component CbiQ [Candidatus Aquicultor sp.]
MCDEHTGNGGVAHHDHADIHLHEHKHGNVLHKHPHYHPSTHGQEQPDEKAHQHSHTYSFEVYAYADSHIHRLDARTKTIALIGLIFAIVLTPASEVVRFAFFAALIGALYLVSGVSLGFGLKRSFIAVPFVLFAGIFLVFMPDKPHPQFYNLGFTRAAITHGGLYIFFNALVKSWLSVLTAIMLYSTTPFPKFVKGLEMMRMPKVITMLFSFMYRFMWVLTDEVKRMLRARDARAFGGGRIWHLKVIGQMVGSLFIRSYERAERVYAAMVSRGYSGTIITLDTPALAARDALFGVVFLTLVVAILAIRF